MRFSLRSSLLALAFSAILTIPASAETIDLAISGNAQVGSNFLNFGLGTANDGGPYVSPPGFGAFTVQQVATGTPFQTLGITVGQMGQIRSFSTTSPSTLVPFMSFNGSTVTMTGNVASGTFGPFFLQDTNFGAVASFNLSGALMSGGTTVANYTGTFSATFNGINSATLLTEIASGVPQHTNYGGTFTATVTPVIPEPGTLLLMGAGLLGAGLVARRRKAKN